MFRLHFAYMSLYQVLECHMEFLGLFGCIWSSKEVIYVIIGRAERWERLPGATPASRSDLPYQSDLTRAMRRSRSPFHPGGSRKLTRSDLSGQPLQVAPEAWSDLSERHSEVAPAESDVMGATGRSRSRFHHSETRERTRSDLSQRHSEVAPKAWSDERRSLRVLFLLELMISQGPFGHFIMHVFIF